MNTGAVGCIHLVRTINRDCLVPHKLRRRISLCCFEKKDFNLTDSNWPSKLRPTTLLTTQIAFHLELGHFSHLQVRVYIGLLEELPTRASLDTPTPRNRDIQLLIHLKLKGDHVDRTESSPSSGNKPEHDPRASTAAVPNLHY